MDSTEIRLECLKLAGGDLDRARELYSFVLGPALTGPDGNMLRFDPAEPLKPATRWVTSEGASIGFAAGDALEAASRFDVVGAHVVRSGAIVSGQMTDDEIGRIREAGPNEPVAVSRLA